MVSKPPDPNHYIAIDEIKVWGIDDTAEEPNYNEGDIGHIILSIRRYGFNASPRLWKEHRCRAGNHGVLALRAIQAQGEIPGYPHPPKRVVEHEGKWYVRWIDVSELSATEALGFAMADNRAAQLASQDESLLAKYLMAVREDDTTVFEATGYEDEDIRRLLARTHAPMFPEGGLPGDSPFAANGEDGEFNLPASTVRMVHLFLDVETIDDFNQKVQALQEHYGLDNLTDTIREVVSRAYVDLA